MKAPVHHRLEDIEAEIVNAQMTRRMLWGERIMMALMDFKKGFIVPTHQHENEQLTYCMSGRMRLDFSNHQVVLEPGDVLLIPGGVPHGAEMLTDVTEMDIFSPPRQDWINKTDSYLRR